MYNIAECGVGEADSNLTLNKLYQLTCVAMNSLFEWNPGRNFLRSQRYMEDGWQLSESGQLTWDEVGIDVVSSLSFIRIVCSC